MLDKVRQIDDPKPFFRGIISDLGYEIKQIPFVQNLREKGLSKNNFYTLYDIAMLGIVSQSVLPIRIASFFGFCVGVISCLIAIIFLILKLFLWDKFQIGMAPIIIGMFFMFGLIFIFIGLIGEYILSIHMYLRRRPLVVEKERINF